VTGALRLYEDDLSQGGDPERRPHARFLDGTTLPLGLERWLGPADATDEQLLDRVSGPVLDVGCGPGRHLHALAARGVFALGVDLSPLAVELAVGRGGRAIVGDIFDELPGSSAWRSALLLDGNIGIGGSPARLLARLRALLDDAGEILAEIEPPWGVTCSTHARLESGGRVTGWFPWARVAAPEIEAIAGAGGFRTAEVWTVSGRWFARLCRHEAPRICGRTARARRTAGAGTVP
jgi:SAM-dependent methyltransferase